MVRTSLTEQYDDKDVLKQIYRLWDSVDKGTIADIDISQSGSVITVKFTMTDESVKVFTLDSKDITDVATSQSGTTVTITFTFSDGTTKDVSFTTTAGAALDKEQTFTAKQTFAKDVIVESDLDVGDDLSAKTLQISGEASLMGDTSVEKLTVEDSAEIGGAAFEQSSSNDLVISPTNRLIVKTGAGANQEMVVGTDSVIVDKLSASTSVTTPSMSATGSATVPTVEKTDSSTNAASTAFVNAFASAVDGTTNNLLHTNGAETKSGSLTLEGNHSELICDIPREDGTAVSKALYFRINGGTAYQGFVNYLVAANNVTQLQLNLYGGADGTTLAYFNLYVRADGTMGIATNLSKPSGW